MSDKIIKPPDTILTPTPEFKNDGKRYFTFKGGYLKEDNAKSEFQKVMNIYTVYNLESNLNYNPDFTLENCLFGGVTIPKILMLISINILDMVLDLVEEEFLHIQLVVLVIMQ